MLDEDLTSTWAQNAVSIQVPRGPYPISWLLKAPQHIEKLDINFKMVTSLDG
ncbi:MAG: hypothetical protein JRL30_15430 [Deltaproteobacteria bacterium]|nr:hypothetical protein [Deltaproteobacteria bacterium]